MAERRDNMLTPQQIDDELQGAVAAVRAATEHHQLETPGDLAALMLAATLGRALEAGVPAERIEQIFGSVMDVGASVRAAAATTAAEQLDVWWESLRTAVHQRIDKTTQPRELFAFVYDFAAGTALGTGLSLPDATTILSGCAQKIAAAVASSPTPPAAPPRSRYSAPTG